MSDPVRICLVGATGLTGWELIEQAVGRSDVHVTAIARREVSLPPGARMELVVADPADWAEAIAFSRAKVMVCALGTTWRKAGKDEAAFRAVDKDLVLACAASRPRRRDRADGRRLVGRRQPGEQAASTCRSRARSRMRWPRPASSGSTSCGPACCAARGRETRARPSGWRCSPRR